MKTILLQTLYVVKKLNFLFTKILLVCKTIL